MANSLGFCDPQGRPGLDSDFLPLDFCSPGSLRHLASKPIDGRLLSMTLTQIIKTNISEFYKKKVTKDPKCHLFMSFITVNIYHERKAVT